MASGFTRPNEKLGRAGLNAIVAKVKGSGATVNDYSKAGKSIVQAAAGSKVRKP